MKKSWGVRVNVNEDLKFLLGGGGASGRGRRVGGGVWLGVRVDVNEELNFL